MALKGYSSYRGRQGFWRRLLIVVLVLILVAACGFLFLQRYITYSDDGSFRLELPFSINWEIPFWNGEDDDSDQPKKTEQDVNLIVDRQPDDKEETTGNDDTADEPPQESQGQEEQPKGEQPYLPPRLIELSELPSDEAALIEALAAVGADGFVFRTKDALGKVRYASAVAIPEAIEETAASRELLGRLCAQEDVYTVASITCFLDSVYAFANMEAAGICQSSKYIWYDANMQHWMDPAKEGARQYLIALALECAQLGFDELMLDTMCYPAEGKLYKIDYSQNAMDKTAALLLFLSELEQALEPYSVRISLRLDETVVRGLAEDTADSGFDALQILPLVDAVYVATTDSATVRQEMQQLLTGKSVPVFIPIVDAVTTEDGWCLVG